MKVRRVGDRSRGSYSLRKGLAHKKGLTLIVVPILFSSSFSNLIIHAASHGYVGTHLAIGHRHMCRVYGVAAQALRILKGGVQHQLGIGAGQVLCAHADVHKSRNLSLQGLQPFLDLSLHGVLLRLRELLLHLP